MSTSRQLEVVARELLLHLVAGLLLDRAAVLDQLDERPGLRDVLEVRGDHRVERLLDQALDVAEALDDERRLPVVDVDDDRQRKRGLERVLGDEAHFGEVLVVAMLAGLVPNPLQDEVRRGDVQDAPRERVERVLAGRSGSVQTPRRFVSTSSPWRYCSPDMSAPRFAGVRDDHADGPDLDDRLRDHLDRREEAVDVVGAVHEHLELPAPIPAAARKRSASWKLL
jgi:hypothetical protein